MTTKTCPLCGNSNLVLFAGTNEKACNNHIPVYYFPWKLGEGQKKLCGNNRDKTRGEIKS